MRAPPSISGTATPSNRPSWNSPASPSRRPTPLSPRASPTPATPTTSGWMGRPCWRCWPMPEAVLPYGRQTIEDDDIAAVVAALKADFLTTGPTVEAFEADFAKMVGSGHAVACSNGTAALHLAMMALDVGPGDVCIAPS